MAHTLKEQTAASVVTPASGKNSLYFDSASGALSFKDDTGAAHTLGEANVPHSVGAMFDGAALPLSLTGTTKVRAGPVPFTGTIQLRDVVLDQSGGCTFGVKKCARASYPGSLSDITGGHDVVISAAAQSEDSTLTGWTTSVTAGDIVEFELKAVDGTIQQATILLKVT